MTEELSDLIVEVGVDLIDFVELDESSDSELNSAVTQIVFLTSLVTRKKKSQRESILFKSFIERQVFQYEQFFVKCLSLINPIFTGGWG